jgi:hypothetical protein
MIAAFIAVGVLAWLFFLLLCLGLARAAADGDRTLRRALARRERRVRRAA